MSNFNKWMKILEGMKAELRLLPDEILRLYIPIKKYFEFLVIPLLGNHLEKDVKAMLLEQAQAEDMRITTKAQSFIDKNILDRKMDGQYVLEINVRLPNGQIMNVKANHIQQFFAKLQQEHEYNLRSVFYKEKNFITQFIKPNQL